MKRIIVIGIMLMLLSLAAVHAEDEKESICEKVIEGIDLEEGVAIDKKIPYKNERFNIYLGDEEAYLVLVDRQVTEIGCGLLEDPTFNVKIASFETIEDIKDAENTLDEFNAKLKSKEITIKGTTIPKKVKGFFTRLGLKIASWFV